MYVRLLVAVFLITGISYAQDTLASKVVSLKECINIALENNSDLKRARYTNEISDYNVLGSYSGILPNVGVQAGGRSSTQGPTTYTDFVPTGKIDSTTGALIYQSVPRTNPKTITKNFSFSATISQNIFDGFRWYDQIVQAKVNKKSSDMNLKSELNSVILSVQTNYYNLVKQEKLYDVYKIAVERSQDQVNRTQKMFDLGAAAKLDVYQAKVNLGDDKINLLTQENVVSNARRTLNISLGRDPATEIEVNTIDDVKLNTMDLDALLESAYENQPLLKKNESDLKSSEIGISIAKANFYPNLSAYFTYGRTNSEIDKLYKNFDQDYYYVLGVSLNWNIFNGFYDHVSVQKAKLTHSSDLEYSENYRRQLKSNVKGFYENYKSYQEIIKINEGNLDAAKEELRLAEERYQIGAGTSLEVREAQVKLTRAEETLIAARYNALITLAELDNELGITQQKLME